MQEKHISHYNEVKHFDTDQLREAFLVNELFVLNTIKAVYSHADRMIIGGVYPENSLDIKELTPPSQTFFLENREMGIINIGGPGDVKVDGVSYHLELMDGLYIGKGQQSVEFSSQDPNNLAKFYFISTVANVTFPTTMIYKKDAQKLELGTAQAANERVLYKYIHPSGVKSCHLVMGFTTMLEGSVWNSMPPHIHERRSEVYLYFNIPQTDLVFHFMGCEDQTRHIVIRNEEAVISPYWSIHSGVGTTNYSFIWAMSGENQFFADARAIELTKIK
ncbi:5-dehydro-4-deoxy-D-glucuronate isomerase [Cellulosilyticum sp. I15G10I2]|uniref:5-dehydro-4-deoxy-D-glucuronate isomerase n=1 Tax=Cellulosilyticum sp. I15G10I2 TaxID=1892843 RepID=UPI00085C8D86|nr:5-dehydro-4-deoxy-D-glucuronate isomerase [Cellulosilyticum sp. I15G10I2]